MIGLKLFTYDLETLVNFFSFAGKFVGDDRVYVFEVSDRKNQTRELLQFLYRLQSEGVVMVGYNSLGFDYPILHQLLINPHTFTYKTAYNVCQSIINGQNYGNAGTHYIKPSERIIPQLDLVKLNHFDNKARRVSLKTLQFAMRSESVEDLPVEIGVPLTHQQMDETISYNKHDVTETEKFLHFCKPAIEMRLDLINKGFLRGDLLNYSDVKIGVEFLINKIGRNKCFIKGSTPKQTTRYTVGFDDIILPNVKFRTDTFNEVLDWFKDQSVNISGGKRPKLETELAGVPFDFGIGGVHASVSDMYYESTKTHVIKDIDVAGMYPAIAIANNFAPEHLGKDFTHNYKQLYYDRKQYPKGTTMNKLLKLAANGVYGNSNNPYSCFYDPKYTFSVTVNGQLQLLQLVEMLDSIPSVQIIQANTDGVTVYMERKVEQFFNMWCRHWECVTNLQLEEVEYSRMWIADVNSYLVEQTDGKMKRKGRYWYPETWEDYEGWWNKDFSKMCVQKAAEYCLRTGCKPEDIFPLMTNPFDFMLRYKTPNGATVYIGNKQQQKTVRYYVSKSGEPMKKIAEPKGEIGQYKRRNKLSDDYFNSVMAEIGKDVWDERVHTKNQSKYEQVTTSVESGWKVKECNDASRFDWSDLDYDYYIKETYKLIEGFRNGTIQ